MPSRVSHAKWMSMTPAQRAALKRSLAKNNQYPSRPRARGKGRITSGRGYGINTTIVSNYQNLFPARTIKYLRYSTNFQLVSTAGAVASYVFGANALYDPDITGTGHQPMGFDQMMQFFSHYTVIRSKLILVAANATSTPMQVCLRYDAAGTPLTVIERILENGGNVNTHLDISGSTNAQKEISLICDIAKLQGVNPLALTADNTLRGDVASNPAELTYFHVQLFSASGFTGTVNFDILIEYTAYFTEPRDDIQS